MEESKQLGDSHQALNTSSRVALFSGSKLTLERKVKQRETSIKLCRDWFLPS